MSRRQRGTGGLGAGASGDWGDDSGDTPSSGIIDDFKQQFFDAVTKFDNATNTLAVRETQLYGIQVAASQDVDDWEQWQSEMSKVSAVSATVQNAQAAVAQASEWWNEAKSFFGLSGLRSTKQLGVLQFAIPWGLLGIIAAATAAVVLIVNSSGSLIDKVTMKAWNAENIRRSQNNLPPLPKPETVGGGLFGDLTGFGQMLIFGFAAWLLLPPLAKRLNK